MNDLQGGGGWGDAGGWPGWPSASGAQPEGVARAPRPAPPDPVLGIVIAAAAALLMLTTLLPWATATLNIPDIGLPPGSAGDELSGSRDYIGVRGLPGLAALLAGLAAALLGAAGAVLGRRLAAFAAVPAVVVFAALGEFLWYLPAESEDLYRDILDQLPGPLGELLRGSVDASLGFGWWLSLALTLVVLGGAIMSTTRGHDS
jgi:hypothetical protein